MQTFSVLGLRPICAAYAALGRDPSEILRAAAIAPEIIADPDARVPVATAFAVFAAAAHNTDDSAFGLKAAGAIPSGALEVLDIAARSAPTAADALDRFVRYYALIDDGAELSLERDGERARIVHNSPRSGLPPLAAIELLFGLIVIRGREITGKLLPIRAARFRNPVPQDREAHDAFFGVHVAFEFPRHELELEASWLDNPVLTADAAVSALVERFLKNATVGLSTHDDIVARTRRAIAESFGAGDPSLGGVAQKLALSRRTLQRKLQAERRSFAEIVDDVRREIALAHLNERRLSISEIGYMLGFSEPSAFHRAFRRWTGLAPSEYRRAHA